MGFAPLGSWFRGGEVADHIAKKNCLVLTTFVIRATEYLLCEFASLGSRFQGGLVADHLANKKTGLS
jgi:hypothetical protein